MSSKPKQESDSPTPKPVEAGSMFDPQDNVTLLVLFRTGAALRVGMALGIASSVVADFEYQKRRGEDRGERQKKQQPIILKALNQPYSILTIDSATVLAMLVEQAFESVEIFNN